jgi:hypothetical protein
MGIYALDNYLEELTMYHQNTSWFEEVVQMELLLVRACCTHMYPVPLPIFFVGKEHVPHFERYVVNSHSLIY